MILARENGLCYHRLAARMPPSQGGDTSSNLVGTTTLLLRDHLHPRSLQSALSKLLIWGIKLMVDWDFCKVQTAVRFCYSPP